MSARVPIGVDPEVWHHIPAELKKEYSSALFSPSVVQPKKLFFAANLLKQSVSPWVESSCDDVAVHKKPSTGNTERIKGCFFKDKEFQSSIQSLSG